MATGTTNGQGRFQVSGLMDGLATITITKGVFVQTFDTVIVAGQLTDLGEDLCLEQDAVRLLVVTGQFDDIGAVLTNLGLTFDTVDGSSASTVTTFFTDSNAMAQYDAIFFNCGTTSAWTSQAGSMGAELRDYVASGGSAYASDWAYFFVENAFPNQVEFIGDDGFYGNARVGDDQTVNATVVDPAMVALVGPTAIVEFDQTDWTAVDTTGGQVLLEASYSFTQPNSSSVGSQGRLATRFSHGLGRVTFTSFHNEAQPTLDMSRLLEDMVLSL